MLRSRPVAYQRLPPDVASPLSPPAAPLPLPSLYPPAVLLSVPLSLLSRRHSAATVGCGRDGGDGRPPLYLSTSASTAVPPSRQPCPLHRQDPAVPSQRRCRRRRRRQWRPQVDPSVVAIQQRRLSPRPLFSLQWRPVVGSNGDNSVGGFPVMF